MTTRLLAIALLALPLSAAASPSPKDEARQHVAKATAAHKAGKFADALQELQTAYALDPQPDLLYAIGQVHVKLGQCAEAIHDYEQFLATNPPAGPAAAANEAITTCKAQLPPEPPPPPPPPAAAPPPAPPPAPAPVASSPAWYTDTLGDVLVGGGAALGIAGAVFYRGALSDLDRADKATTYDAQKSAVDDAHSKRTLSIVFAAGGAVAITAGILHYMHHSSHGAEHVAITPTPGGGAITFLGSF